MKTTETQELESDIGSWAFVLRDHGLTFRDFRSNGQRFVEIRYAPLVTEVPQVTQDFGV